MNLGELTEPARTLGKTGLKPGFLGNWAVCADFLGNWAVCADFLGNWAVCADFFLINFCWGGVGKGGNVGTTIWGPSAVVEPIGSTIWPKGSVLPFFTTINRSVLFVG